MSIRVSKLTSSSCRTSASFWRGLRALALLVLTCPGLGTAEAQPAPQWRGFWVDTFNTRLSTAEDTAAVVARAQQAHANALFVQVRRRGDAWYLDALEPVPDNVPFAPNFDPLRDLVVRAHDAGLQVHAFVVAGTIWSSTTFPYSPTHVFNAHGFGASGPRPARENWLTRTLLADGSATSLGGFRFGNDFWIDFGHPDAAAYTVDVLRHLVAQYDVDGLHLDRLRYPEIALSGQDAGTGANVGYNDVSLERFRRRQGLGASAVPAPSDAAWSEWRREQVTAVVRRLYLEITAIKPRVVLSAAVIAFGDAPPDEAGWSSSESYWRVFQDWRAWTEEGIVDLIVPMVYRAEHTAPGADSFGGWTGWTRAHTYDRHAAIGLGAYLNSVEGTVRQIRRASSATQGALLYSLGAHNAPVTANPLAASRDTPYRPFEDVAAALTTGRTTSGQSVEPLNGPAAFADHAPVPSMPWKNATDRGHVKGTVASASGVVDGAEIVLEAEAGGSRVAAVRTDGNGFFGRVNVPPGSYRVLVTPLNEGSYRSSCSVVVEGGAVASIDLRVDASSPVTATCLSGSPARATRRP